MPIDPNAIGATTKPHLMEWTDRDTMLYAQRTRGAPNLSTNTAVPACNTV